MPLILAFTAEDGTVYTASYWRIVPVSFNSKVKTGSFQLHGWTDIDCYNAGMPNIGASPKEFNITNPTDYDRVFGETALVSQYPFLEWLESYASEAGFFLTADQYSHVAIVSADIGSFDSSRIYIRFNDTVTHLGGGGNFTDGVTIKVNGVGVAISAAAQDSPPSIIRYDLATPIDANDVVTWEYDALSGDLTSAGFTALTSFPAFSVTNEIGSFLNFSLADNSIHLATVM